MPSANIVTKVVCFVDSGVVGLASGEMVRLSVANMGESPIHILAGRFLDTEGKMFSEYLERKAVGPGQAFLFDLDRRSVEAPGNRIEVRAVVEFTGDPAAVHCTTQVVNLETGRNNTDCSLPGNILTTAVSFAHSGVVGLPTGHLARFSVANKGASPLLILAGRYLDIEGKTLGGRLEQTAVGPSQAFLFDLDRRSVEAPGNRIEVQAVVEFTGDAEAVVTTTQVFEVETGRIDGVWQNHNETLLRDGADAYLGQDDRGLQRHKKDGTTRARLPVSAPALNRQAAACRAQGWYEEAEWLLRRALRLVEEEFGSRDASLSPILNNLGVVCKHMGRFSECGPLYRRALAIAARPAGAGTAEVATIYHNMGGLDHALGRYDRAEEFARRALAIRERALGADHPDVAADAAALAAILDGQKRHDEAEPLHWRALGVLEKAHGPDPLDVAVALNNLATLRQAKEDRDAAEGLYRRAIAVKEKVCGPAHPEVGVSLNNLGVLCKSQGRHDEAGQLYRRALNILIKTVGPCHPDAAMCRLNLARLARCQGTRPSRLGRGLSRGERAR